jgi:hypothetical protein
MSYPKPEGSLFSTDDTSILPENFNEYSPPPLQAENNPYESPATPVEEKENLASLEELEERKLKEEIEEITRQGLKEQEERRKKRKKVRKTPKKDYSSTEESDSEVTNYSIPIKKKGYKRLHISLGAYSKYPLLVVGHEGRSKEKKDYISLNSIHRCLKGTVTARNNKTKYIPFKLKGTENLQKHSYGQTSDFVSSKTFFSVCSIENNENKNIEEKRHYKGNSFDSAEEIFFYIRDLYDTDCNPIAKEQDVQEEMQEREVVHEIEHKEPKEISLLKAALGIFEQNFSSENEDDVELIMSIAAELTQYNYQRNRKSKKIEENPKPSKQDCDSDDIEL